VQQVLEFNKEITQCLGNRERSESRVLPHTDNIPRRGVMSIEVPPGVVPPIEVPAIALKKAALKEGEASQTSDDDEISVISMEPRKSMRQQVMETVRGLVGKVISFRSRSGSLEEPMLATDPSCNGFQPRKKGIETPRGMFPNANDVKENVVRALTKQEYNVEDFYKSTGYCQYIAKNDSFKHLTCVVIAINIIWIAIETDQNKAEVLSEAPLLYQIVDNLFCIFFAFEIAVRFSSFSIKLNAAMDGQFMFDLFLVVLMVLETWISVLLFCLAGGVMDLSGSAASLLRIFRLFRLTRVARVGRLLRNIPELMILVKGMLMAMRAVSATLMLLLIIIYVFAIIFTQLLWNDPAGKGCFETVPMAMHCLLMNGVFSDQAQFIEQLLSSSIAYYVFILCYMVLGSLTVLNMLLGVICEVMSVVAQVEKDELMAKELQNKIHSIQSDFKVEGFDMVSAENFKRLVHNQDALECLNDVNVDVVALVDFADFIFREKEELPLSEFIAGVMQFRGANTATVKDVVDMRKFVSREFRHIHNTILDRSLADSRPGELRT